MDIWSFRHKALQRFFETGNVRGLNPAWVPKLRRMLTAIAAAETIEDLTGVPGWKAHELAGDRKGVWALWVTGNWRLTFRCEEDAVHDLDLEDYH
ncbi:MAG: type II toxin-antitoxin system RelE/ParE family toxin [Hyphomicrobiales bacterium]